jgi:NDP-sugar pyrophosphorylase family protein
MAQTIKKKIKYMIKQAVILAGGKGTRLLPLTKNLPKPMVLVNKVPFLSYLIYYLKKNGIRRVLILVGYKSRKIINYYNKITNIKIEFSYSNIKSDTGKRVIDAYEFLDNEFLLLYGDNFWVPSIKKMYQNFKNRNALISTTVFNNKFATGEYGKENNIYVNNNLSVARYDKKRKEKKLNGVDIGFFIIKKKFINFFKKSKNYSFENDMLTKAIELKKLIAYRTNRQYFSITNLKMLKKFQLICTKKKLKYILKK